MPSDSSFPRIHSSICISSTASIRLGVRDSQPHELLDVTVLTFRFTDSTVPEVVSSETSCHQSQTCISNCCLFTMCSFPYSKEDSKNVKGIWMMGHTGATFLSCAHAHTRLSGRAMAAASCCDSYTAHLSRTGWAVPCACAGPARAVRAGVPGVHTPRASSPAPEGSLGM